MDGNSTRNCPAAALDVFSKSMRVQMWRVNALLGVNAVLMGVVAGIGAYGQRYRHHPLSRFLFLGATALFLPIVSYVVSTTNNQYMSGFVISSGTESVTAFCHPSWHVIYVLVWTGLVQVVGINTTAIVAADFREGRSISPSVVLLVQAIWTSYLVVYTLGTASDVRRFKLGTLLHGSDTIIAELILLPPFAILFAKALFKCYAFFKARRSFALGSNPRLVARYMDQLQDVGQHAELLVLGEHQPPPPPPPPLVVMGEDTLQLEKQSHGYHFICMSNQGDRARIISNHLVTLDKVWQLDDMLTRSVAYLKDVCLSFALFKLLRCQFARYTVAEAKSAMVHRFFWQVLFKDKDDERVLRVIADELCFFYDYYYSSLPISYLNSWLPIVSIFISILSISYCILAGAWIILNMESTDSFEQITCRVHCMLGNKNSQLINFGNLLFDLVPLYTLVALVVLVEVRDITSYICSNWTKVALMCRYVVNHDTWNTYPATRKWVGCLLQCKCKLMNPWKDKMNQCSILVLHPRKTPLVNLLRCLIPLPEQKTNIKVPKAVKATIMDKLRSNNGILSNGVISLRQSVPDGDSLLWACSGEATTDILLVWHIATSILEVRHPAAVGSNESDNKVVATHLSRYCAYLVTHSPELLPDDDGWSKILYKAVKEDAALAVADRARVSTPEEEYQQLVQLLSANSQHDMIKNGVRLAKQLVELILREEEEAAWEVLAGFWSEMILYVALSGNLDGHAEAIARGGELITLIWALLTHAGIASRPRTAAASVDV